MRCSKLGLFSALTNRFYSDNGLVSEARGTRLRSVSGESVKGFLSRHELNQPAGGDAIDRTGYIRIACM